MGGIRDVSNLRNKPQVNDLMSAGRGELTDLSGHAKVELDWKLNEDAIRDKVFKITINGEEAYIDLEELMFYQRIMF